MGIYRYTGDVLDDLALPDDLEKDRQTIIDNLLMETAELEILYPDSWFLKQAIGAWSRKQVRVWQEMYDTTQYEYNPIWNKDGVYTEERELKGNSQTDGSSSSNVVSDHDVYGYNSSTAAPESKDTTNGTQSGTTETDTTTTEKVKRLEQGNIGVTTTQQMIKEQREVTLFNIIDFIISDFKQRFCLLIY